MTYGVFDPPPTWFDTTVPLFFFFFCRCFSEVLASIFMCQYPRETTRRCLGIFPHSFTWLRMVLECLLTISSPV